MTPTVGLSGATSGLMRPPSFRFNMRIGFWTPSRNPLKPSGISHSRSTVLISRIMTAKGFAGLCLRARSRATALSDVASQQR